MKLQGIDETTCIPDWAPADIKQASEEEKSKYFEDVCKLIVRQVWHKLDTDQLKHDEGTGLPVFCCGEDKDENVIGCEARSKWQNNDFFHYSCANLNLSDNQSPWFCSNKYRQQSTVQYQYCTCKTDLGTDKPMIDCSAKDLYLKEEWYHMKCIGLDPNKTVKGHWFCDEECKRRWRRRRGSNITTPWHWSGES